MRIYLPRNSHKSTIFSKINVFYDNRKRRYHVNKNEHNCVNGRERNKLE